MLGSYAGSYADGTCGEEARDGPYTAHCSIAACSELRSVASPANSSAVPKMQTLTGLRSVTHLFATKASVLTVSALDFCSCRHLATSTNRTPTFAKKTRHKRPHPVSGWKQLTSKRGTQNFYKGRGSTPTGVHTSRGHYVTLPSRKPNYVLPGPGKHAVCPKLGLPCFLPCLWARLTC